MIKVVLKMYLAKIQNEKKQKKRDKNREGDIIRTRFLITIIALIFLLMGYLAVTIFSLGKIWCQIVTLILAFLVPFYIYRLDKHDIQMGRDDFVEYNKKLNLLHDVLTEIKYSKNGKKNWCSKNKIEYLINECTEMINHRLLPQKRTLEFVKLMILPIISFVAGVISQKTNIEQAIQYAVIALFIVIIIWGIKQIIEFIDEITMKSSSVSTIESVRHMLSDLLVRDFGYERKDDEQKKSGEQEE